MNLLKLKEHLMKETPLEHIKLKIDRQTFISFIIVICFSIFFFLVGVVL